MERKASWIFVNLGSMLAHPPAARGSDFGCGKNGRKGGKPAGSDLRAHAHAHRPPATRPPHWTACAAGTRMCTSHKRCIYSFFARDRLQRVPQQRCGRGPSIHKVCVIHSVEARYKGAMSGQHGHERAPGSPTAPGSGGSTYLEAVRTSNASRPAPRPPARERKASTSFR